MRSLVMVVLLGACGTEESDVIELGRIDLAGDPYFGVMIDAPSSAAVGEPFVVRVITYGGGCKSVERTDVEMTTAGADVLPWDRDAAREGVACPSDLRLMPHEAMLTFDAPGTKTIRIRGRRVSLGINENVDEMIQVPRIIEVQ